MDNVHLSTTIKALCKSQNITVKKLLEDCRVSRNFIYDLEKKGQMPSIDKLEAIADYLDCSVDYLLGRHSPSETKKDDSTEALPPDTPLTLYQKQLIEFAESLTEEEVKKVLSYIRFVLSERDGK